jgi:hypothetical protein
MADQNPSKSTYPGAPGTTEIVFSKGALAIMAGMMSGIGGVFLWFNGNVCQPQIQQAREDKAEIARQLAISNEQLAKALVLLEQERQRNP